MDKRALEVFAPAERSNLREAVERRLSALGIDAKSSYENETEWMNVEGGVMTINGTQYTNVIPELYRQLFKEYRAVGYDALVEETAYTWFNRLMAVRYMEVKGVLPDIVKIIGNNGIIPRPEILANYQYLGERVNRNDIEELKSRDEEAAYRRLFLAACNKLGDALPFLFKPLDDWMELLLPHKMLEPGGIIDRIVSNDGLTSSFEDGVEAIGWLYQFYISQIKEEVMELKKVKKELVPPRTQIFTKKWVVQYMVDNSLGQLWLEANPASSLKDFMKYHIDTPKQMEKVQKQLETVRYSSEEIEKITFLDPAAGSGHILSYAFDLFYEIYAEMGYPKSQIPSIILEKNLYGIDVDERAAQLASFTLMMKAANVLKRSVWRQSIQPKVIAIKESNSLDENYFNLVFEGKQREKAKVIINYFHDAKEYGSLLQPEALEINELLSAFESNQTYENQSSLFDVNEAENVDASGQLELFKQLLIQHKWLSSKYDIVVTNPPYMGSTFMSPRLSKFAKSYYKQSKGDLFAMFMERIFSLTKEGGFSSNVTMQSWMFLSTYDSLRKFIVDNYGIAAMVHMDNNVMGIAFGTAATVFRKSMTNYNAQYMFVTMKHIEKDKPIKFPVINERFQVASTNQFSHIAGAPIAYWATDSVNACFLLEDTFDDISPAKKGLDTNGESELFFRNWYEVESEKIFGVGNQQAHQSKWFEINKGGGFRRWFGNRLDIINYKDDGYLLKNKSKKANIRNESFYFRESLTYGVVTSSKFSFRQSDRNSLFDQGGPNCFPAKEYMGFILALGNSKVVEHLLTFIAPTLNFTVGDINKLPIKIPSHEILMKINALCDNNILISRQDWNSFEISWDFSKHPFVDFRQNTLTLLDEAYNKWKECTENSFTQLKSNEEELNHIFIELYGLGDELTIEVPDTEITIRKSDRRRDTKSFLSFFIGCWLGRYSLDVEGLVYTGGVWNETKYSTFQPSHDGIVTFTDEKVLQDEYDVYERLKEFLTVIYGEDTLQENLAWIAENLGQKSESVEKTIRNYFVKNFAKDHIQLYQKRPIYWPIDSGKENGMKSFVYLHRYTPQTMGLAMNNHFVPLLGQWRSLAQVTEEEVNSGLLSSTEKKAKVNQLNTYRKRVEELERFQDKLHDIARAEIEIDLDDGVKRNYLEFKSVLTPIKM